MTTALALSETTLAGMIVAGLVVYLISVIWMLIVAAQRSVLWLLAVLLLPIAQLIFVLVEPRARGPFLAIVFAIGTMIGGIVMMERKPSSEADIVDRVVKALRHDSGGNLEARKDRIRKWQKKLGASRAALRPGDTAGQARFNDEFKQYIAELEEVKAAMNARTKN